MMATEYACHSPSPKTWDYMVSVYTYAAVCEDRYSNTHHHHNLL